MNRLQEWFNQLDDRTSITHEELEDRPDWILTNIGEDGTIVFTDCKNLQKAGENNSARICIGQLQPTH